jgi:large subunit ribosomal protein L23
MSRYDILRLPHITEKATIQKDEFEGRMVVFKVRPEATKRQVKAAVQGIFEVEVESVRTANFRGKVKRMGKYRGRRANWKKAYVTLKPGQDMPEFFDTV